MNKLISGLFFLFCFPSLKAQTLESIINSNRVDTFAFYTSQGSNLRFLFWTKENKYYVSRQVFIDKKEKVETIITDSFAPLLFFLSNKQSIQKSIIKPFARAVSSVIGNKQDTFPLKIAHDFKYDWLFYEGDDFKRISLSDFNLWENSIAGNYTNVYFDYNNSQPITIFFRKTEEILKQFHWLK
jgi:hypothetical protein